MNAFLMHKFSSDEFFMDLVNSKLEPKYRINDSSELNTVLPDYDYLKHLSNILEISDNYYSIGKICKDTLYIIIFAANDPDFDDASLVLYKAAYYSKWRFDPQNKGKKIEVATLIVRSGYQVPKESVN